MRHKATLLSVLLQELIHSEDTRARGLHAHSHAHAALTYAPVLLPIHGPFAVSFRLAYLEKQDGTCEADIGSEVERNVRPADTRRIESTHSPALCTASLAIWTSATPPVPPGWPGDGPGQPAGQRLGHQKESHHTTERPRLHTHTHTHTYTHTHTHMSIHIRTPVWCVCVCVCVSHL